MKPVIQVSALVLVGFAAALFITGGTSLWEMLMPSEEAAAPDVRHQPPRTPANFTPSDGTAGAPAAFESESPPRSRQNLTAEQDAAAKAAKRRMREKKRKEPLDE